jgi:sulfur-carrier protein
MPNLSIHYFALLKDEAKINQEILQTNAKTCLELYDELRLKYDFSLEAKYLMVAVNDQFTHFDHQLCNGDKVVFIPPVAGG